MIGAMRILLPSVLLLVSATDLAAQTTRQVPQLLEEVLQQLRQARSFDESNQPRMAELEQAVEEARTRYRALPTGSVARETARAQLQEAVAERLWLEGSVLRRQLEAIQKADANLRTLGRLADRLAGDEDADTGFLAQQIRRTHAEGKRLERSLHTVYVMLDRLPLTPGFRALKERELRELQTMHERVADHEQGIRAQMAQLSGGYREALLRHINGLRAVLGSFSFDHMEYRLEAIKTAARVLGATLEADELSDSVHSLVRELHAMRRETGDDLEALLPSEAVGVPGTYSDVSALSGLKTQSYFEDAPAVP